MVRARFDRYVHGRATGAFPRFLERLNFCVFYASEGMKSAADHFPIPHHHRADSRIGRGSSPAARGKVQGFFERVAHM